MEYLQEYGRLLIFLGLVIATPILLLSVSFAGVYFKLRPERKTRAKLDAYESGLEPLSEKPRNINFRYYYFALLFIIFDVETVLLYPIAVSYGVSLAEYGISVLIAFFIFLVVVTLPFLYVWMKKALEWN